MKSVVNVTGSKIVAMASARAVSAVMPEIIYGTAWKEAKTTEFVVQAIVAGYRGIDTACQPKHYQEDLVGKAVAEVAKLGIPRESLFLQTKFTSIRGQDPKRVPYDRTAALPDQVAQSFRVSQANLGTQFIDSLVLHSPMATHSDTMVVWRAMERIHSEGLVGMLGVSNIYEPAELTNLYKEARVKPSVVQNRFYKDTGYDVEIRDFCRKNAITYQSFWTLSANPHLVRDQKIRTIAQRENVTHAQVLFRWLTQLGIVPLTGTKNHLHLQQDLDIFKFTLSARDLEELAPLLH